MINADALKAVLKALQKNCYDDMADDKSEPDEKMADAVIAVGNDEDDLDEDEEPVLAVEEEKPEEEEEADPVRAALKDFIKTKAPPAPRPGTAMFVASSDKKPMAKKKSIKDLMNG